MKLRLTVAYDGTGFSGWQSQPDGNTVQDHLEKAFAALCPGRTAVHGAGRTDAGVHAEAQCAHAEVPDGRLALAGWRNALNAHLPAEIRVMGVRRVPQDFHARFSARGKTYRYTIWDGPVAPPLENNRLWHVPQALDFDSLLAACALFTGTHDFAAYSAKRSKQPESTVRTITSLSVARRGSRITLTFSGDGFLYKMVRMLAGAAVRCAMGKMPLDEVAARLRDGSPRMTQVAPACGLCLLRVSY